MSGQSFTFDMGGMPQRSITMEPDGRIRDTRPAPEAPDDDQAEDDPIEQAGREGQDETAQTDAPADPAVDEDHGEGRDEQTEQTEARAKVLTPPEPARPRPSGRRVQAK